MILTIDTTEDNFVLLLLSNNQYQYRSRIKAERKQAEKLLPSLEKMMKKHKITWSQIKEIKVQSEGGSFTSLRIGILTANALAYALRIPVGALNNDAVFNFKGGMAVNPKYKSEPNIGPPRPAAC